jgi:hypothetical protein
VFEMMKRCPGTNLADAEVVCGHIFEDEASLPAPMASPAGSQGLAALLDSRGVRHVAFSDYLRIDAAERERGRAAGKPREKFASIPEMLEACA